ncbi:hypothetical protein AAMO2058_001464800 [Amorphochlora amoebiformis]
MAGRSRGLLKVIPPLRFEEVEPDLYRGAYPTLRNLPFLESLGLHTIISIIPEKPTEDLRNFARLTKAQIIWHKVSKYKESVSIRVDKARDIIESLIKPEAGPLYIHCIDGQQVTGLIIMCLRKLQNWSTSAIYSEFSRFVPERKVPSEEKQFLGRFDGGELGLLLPSRIPKWLWQGIKTHRHPSIRIVSERKRVEVKPATPETSVRRSPESLKLDSAVSAVFFVDPISSTKRLSVAYFDSLLCSPQNLRLFITAGPREYMDDPTLTPPIRPLGMPTTPSTPLDRAGSARTLAETHPRGSDLVNSVKHFRPSPYIMELINDDSGAVSATLHSLLLEGITATPTSMCFAE